MDLVHIIPEPSAFLQRAYARAAHEAALVGGVEAERAHHLHRLFPLRQEGALQKRERFVFLFQRPVGIQLDAVAVADAVEIDEQLVPLDRLVLSCEACRAEHALFLVVKKDHADLAAQLLRQRQQKLKQRHNAAGIVVGGVPVGSAVDHPPDAESKHKIHRGYCRPERRVQVEQHDLCRNGGKKHRQAEQKLVKQIPQEIARRNKIRQRQHRAGVIVRRKDHVRRIGVADDNVVAFHQPLCKPDLRLIPLFAQERAQPRPKCLLLLPALSDLEALQNDACLFFHRLSSLSIRRYPPPYRARARAGRPAQARPDDRSCPR